MMFLYKCSDCGMLHDRVCEPTRNPCPRSEGFYCFNLTDDTFKSPREKVGPHQRNEFYKKRLQALGLEQTHLLRSIPMMNVLSIGVGDISESNVIRDLFPGVKIKYIAVEIDQGELEKAKISAHGEDIFICGDASDLTVIKKSLQTHCPGSQEFHLIIVRHPQIKPPSYASKEAIEIIAPAFARILTDVSACFLAERGAMVVSNHFSREFKKTLSCLSSITDTPLRVLQPSVEAPFQEEPTVNLFHDSVTITLFSDRFVSGILEFHANECAKKTKADFLSGKYSIDEKRVKKSCFVHHPGFGF